MAFAAFADAPVDVAVVEVGLGGRWDATNVVNAPVAVITPIGVDHADYLGDTIAEIAAEKAGIITKQDDDLVPTDTVAVIGAAGARGDGSASGAGGSRRCRGGARGLRVRGAAAARSPSAASCSNCRASAACTPRSSCRCTASIRRTTRWSRWPRSRRSSARARTVSSTSTRCGPASPPVTSPGRLERMRSAPTVFIDAAHNPAGAAALAQALAEEFDFRFLVGVVSVMADKDVDGILAALEPAFDQIVVTHNGSPRALDVEALALRAEERFGPERVITAATLPDAIETATALVEESGNEDDRLRRQRAW